MAAEAQAPAADTPDAADLAHWRQEHYKAGYAAAGRGEPLGDYAGDLNPWEGGSLLWHQWAKWREGWDIWHIEQDGYRVAATDGLPKANPQQAGTPEADAWMRGWRRQHCERGTSCLAPDPSPASGKLTDIKPNQEVDWVTAALAAAPAPSPETTAREDSRYTEMTRNVLAVASAAGAGIGARVSWKQGRKTVAGRVVDVNPMFDDDPNPLVYVAGDDDPGGRHAKRLDTLIVLAPAPDESGQHFAPPAMAGTYEALTTGVTVADPGPAIDALCSGALAAAPTRAARRGIRREHFERIAKKQRARQKQGEAIKAALEEKGCDELLPVVLWRLISKDYSQPSARRTDSTIAAIKKRFAAPSSPALAKWLLAIVSSSMEYSMSAEEQKELATALGIAPLEMTQEGT